MIGTAAVGRVAQLHPVAEVLPDMNLYLCRLTLLTAALATLCAAVTHAADAPTGSAPTALAPGSADGHDWPQWRGPHFDGSGEAANLPEKFDQNENLLWKQNLPG